MVTLYLALSHFIITKPSALFIEQNAAMIRFIIYYFLIINALTLLVYGVDKLKAKRGRWRIAESTLLLLAVMGGSIGAWLGMKMWHHKTHHKKFKYGIPVIFFLQVASLCYVLYLQ